MTKGVFKIYLLSGDTLAIGLEKPCKNLYKSRSGSELSIYEVFKIISSP